MENKIRKIIDRSLLECHNVILSNFDVENSNESALLLDIPTSKGPEGDHLAGRYTKHNKNTSSENEKDSKEDNVVNENGNTLQNSDKETKSTEKSELKTNDSSIIMHPQNSEFQKLLLESGLGWDNEGIFHYDNGSKYYISNFKNIEFVANTVVKNDRVRIVKVDGTTIELKPQDILNLSSFNRNLLTYSNFCLELPTKAFPDFRKKLLSLDNGRFLTQTNGFGRITDRIVHLGNKIIVDGKPIDFKNPIWLENNGFTIEKTDLIKIADDTIDLDEIWNYFFRLYGMKAVLVIGYAVVTLFTQEHLKEKKHFPILYILAASGKGKGGLAELICALFGMNESLAIINCAGNSTPVGIETKSMLLNDLPIVLNEASEDNFDYIKGRYDGQGSVKFKDDKSNSISERSVNGSTIVTTVIEPQDKQIISRCIFVDLDSIDPNKALFDEAREKSGKFSGFAVKVLESATFEDILNHSKDFAKGFDSKIASPRIVDNHNLIGAGFNTFRDLVDNKEILPSKKEVATFLENQKKTTESYLNPIFYFIIELERLADLHISQTYLTHDDKYTYFNFNGIWNLIKDSYKAKHFPFMKDSNIKELLCKSDYIAVYGVDLPAPDKSKIGKPVISFSKKIDSNSRRCYVLRKEKLPGYYR